MKPLFIPRTLILAVGCSVLLPSLVSANEDFIEGASATLQARNYYFSRDFSDIVGPSQQSRAEEWAQGFILRASTGYTAGTVGVGVDLLGQLGIKLDSGGGRINTGLLPADSDGKAPD
ncbi:MAG: OprD family porin, partial [Pseudomonas formosensis]|nr:OprD family porin [Halopseudomonas formosensis]